MLLTAHPVLIWMSIYIYILCKEIFKLLKGGIEYKGNQSEKVLMSYDLCIMSKANVATCITLSVRPAYSVDANTEDRVTDILTKALYLKIHST